MTSIYFVFSVIWNGDDQTNNVTSSLELVACVLIVVCAGKPASVASGFGPRCSCRILWLVRTI